MRLRKLLVGVAAVAMPLTVMSTVIGVGAAWATTGTGNYNCKKVTGTITFTPALKTGGTSAETTKVTATATTCSGTASPKPTKVIGTATIHSSTNSCAGLASGTPPTITAKYTPTVTNSTLTFTTETFQTSPHLGFTVSGGTATGSYPNSAGTASVKVQTSETLSAFNTACGSSAGLKSLKITSGSTTNG